MKRDLVESDACGGNVAVLVTRDTDGLEPDRVRSGRSKDVNRVVDSGGEQWRAIGCLGLAAIEGDLDSCLGNTARHFATLLQHGSGHEAGAAELTRLNGGPVTKGLRGVDKDQIADINRDFLSRARSERVQYSNSGVL